MYHNAQKWRLRRAHLRAKLRGYCFAVSAALGCATRFTLTGRESDHQGLGPTIMIHIENGTVVLKSHVESPFASPVGVAGEERGSWRVCLSSSTSYCGCTRPHRVRRNSGLFKLWGNKTDVILIPPKRAHEHSRLPFSLICDTILTVHQLS